MNPIQSLSTPITVPAFGQGKPVESVNRPEALRVELDPARAEKLTEAILVAQQLEKAGASLQPQLRGPANGLPDDPRVAEFVSRAANEGVSGAAMLQDSFDRHFSTAAEDVDAADHAKDTPETVQRSLSPAWAALFAAFMDALRESRRANRELSVEQSAAAFESTKNAGKSAIEAARSNMLASIVATTVTTTISAGHVAKSAQGAKVLNTSAQQNQIPQQPAAATPPAAPSSATPASAIAPPLACNASRERAPTLLTAKPRPMPAT